MSYPNEIMIGTYAGGVGGMVTVAGLGEDTYTPGINEGSFTVNPMKYSQVITLADGTELEAGWLETEWHINGLRGAQYDAIDAYRTAHTTQLYIRTLDADGKTYKNFLVNAIFPTQIDRADPTAVEDGAVFDYPIRFIQAVEQV